MNEIKRMPGWMHFAYFILGFFSFGIFWIIWAIHAIIYAVTSAPHNSRVRQEIRTSGIQGPRKPVNHKKSILIALGVTLLVLVVIIIL